MGGVGRNDRSSAASGANNKRPVPKPQPKDPGENVFAESCQEKVPLRELCKTGPWGIKTLTSLSLFSLWHRAVAPSVHTSQEAGGLRGRLIDSVYRWASLLGERTDGKDQG